MNLLHRPTVLLDHLKLGVPEPSESGLYLLRLDSKGAARCVVSLIPASTAIAVQKIPLTGYDQELGGSPPMANCAIGVGVHLKICGVTTSVVATLVILCLFVSSAKKEEASQFAVVTPSERRWIINTGPAYKAVLFILRNQLAIVKI